MLKIKINGLNESDVTSMDVEGWHVSINVNESNHNEDFIMIENGRIRFVLKYTTDLSQAEVDEHNITDAGLYRYVDGKLSDFKPCKTDGSGLAGTVYIMFESDKLKTWAYFRNERILRLVDSFGIDKLIIAPSDYITDGMYKLYEVKAFDGELINDVTGTQLIGKGKWLYGYDSTGRHVLILGRKYNINEIEWLLVDDDALRDLM